MVTKNSKSFKNALFINFGGIGDEILFFPTLKDFKNHYPDCKVTLLVEPRSACSVNLTNTIDEALKYDVKKTGKVKAFTDLVNIIRSGSYDLVISSGSNKFISVLLFLGGVKTRIGYDSGWLSRKLLSRTVALNKNQYAGDMYHDLLSGIDIFTPAGIPEIIVSEADIQKADELIGTGDKPLITIHPGVSKLSVEKNILKSWPSKSWSELIFKLLETGLYRVALTGGPDDAETVEVIREFISKEEIDKSNFIDLFGKTENIMELAAIIKLSRVLVCVDSAPMHIGVGVRTKVVALFGPTDENKLLPENKEFLAIRKQDLLCRPCLWDKGNEVCNQPQCLDIAVEEMYSAISRQQMI